MFRIRAHWRGEIVYVEQTIGLDWKTRTTLHDDPADTTPLTGPVAARVAARLVQDNTGADPWDALTAVTVVPA